MRNIAAILFCFIASLIGSAWAEELRLVVQAAGADAAVPGAALQITADDDFLRAGADSRGRYTLELKSGQPKRLLNILVEAPGFVPALVTFFPSSGDVLPQEFTVSLEQGTSIGGKVEFDDATPLAGAEVRIETSSTRSPHVRDTLTDYAVTTDENGVWRCNLIPEQPDFVRLRVKAPGQTSYKTFTYRPGGANDLEGLRAATEVLTLERRYSMTGVVVDESGAPVQGALLSAWGADAKPAAWVQTRSDSAGAYELPNCKPGSMIVLAQGKENLPVQIFAMAGPDTEPLNIILPPGKRLHGTVVDEQGEGIAGARIIAVKWHDHDLLNWTARTDSAGRFLWEGAPADDVTYAVFHDAYVPVEDLVLRAGPDPQTITLHERIELRLTGHVTDAETGAPVDWFTLIPGYLTQGSDTPVWQPEAALEAFDGQFELYLSDEFPEYRLRVEADTYLPRISPAYEVSAGAAEFSVALSKGDGPEGMALQPDGAPAAGGQAILIPENQSTLILNGRARQGEGTEVVQTTESGTFRFSPQTSAFAVVVVHETGYAFVDESGLASSVQLEPWAEVDGKLELSQVSAGGRGLTLVADREHDTPRVAVRFLFETRTEADGRFRFTAVPPGPIHVALDGGGGQSAGQFPVSTTLDLKSGEAGHINLGGAGSTVTGQIAVPDDLAGEVDLNVLSVRLEQAASGISVATPVSALGAFNFNSVPPGEYRLTADIPGADGAPLGRIERQLAVTGGEDIELGALQPLVQRVLQAGSTAPAFTVPTLDGGALALDEFRGQYVLLDFWATWCGFCIVDLPYMKDLYREFGDDDRFVMIGLSLDSNPETARRFVEQEGIAWPQGFLGSWGDSEVPDLYGVNGIPATILIDPEGKIVARDLRGRQIREKLLKLLQ